METIGSWFRKNAGTVIMLLAIFGLALFLRAYFPLDISLQQHLLSGGSDSFYWERIIRNVVNTGHQLDWDPMLNYPMGLGNPRPPLFNWLIAVPGIALSPLFGDVWQSVMTVFILSTAIWGALTIFPTYFLTKNIFGRRAGLIAAFLLAIMPAHLQRSQATDADHDSMVLFFVVTSFYFFMRALQVLSEKRWIASWNPRTKEGRASIGTGVKGFFRANQKSVLYSVMSGLAMATVALIWQGWAYAPIILLIYIVIQLLVDRLRDKDPMGMGICFTITMGTALLLAAPWYVLYGQIKVWYDVPLILFLAATAFGFVLTVTRDYPWAMVVPSVLIGGISIVVILAIMNPAVATAFVSGAGYFVRTKLYETIAEAQPPGISQAILSFGAATYYLSLFGLFWMAWKLPKRLRPDYMFILTWSFASIFMSMAAARFIFNAGPAFALTAGWVIGLLVEKLDFEAMKKTFSSLAGGSKLTAIRKSIKVKHILGSLFIVFLLLLPNAWYGVDASIPYEQKASYDRQVYYALPGFMRPEGYTPPVGRGGGTHYFGAFGYSLPLPSGYFPAAWDWLSKEDGTMQPEERPAYLSWWDYGFEAVDRGAHPTVADNFQDGYQLAGQFITAQSEDQAIGLLILRLIDGDYYGNRGRLSSDVTAALERYGIDPIKIVNSYHNSASLASAILADPIKYGRWDSRMQATNALYIYLSQYIHEVTTTDQISSLYHDISEATGWSIRYFGVDSRMFPYSGSGNNIFYAPVKLSDHRVQELPDGRVLPVDFFGIDAQTDKGTFPAALVPLGAQVTSYDIKYTDMFYNSMFYRAYMGFGPSDIDLSCSKNDCLPGVRGELQSMMPLQGWNMSHFKVVYKTAYYNPWSISEVQNHTEDWTAMNYFDALDIQRKINRYEAVGVIDFLNSTLAQSGVVFLKYYDGAYVNGTVTVDGVIPIPGVRVTVQDYEDPSNPIPHYTTLTDENGRYSVLAPFGDIRIVISAGALTKRTMTGATILDQEFLTVTDDQAMRKNEDIDGDGRMDYEINLDIAVRGVTVDGTVFLDFNRDGNLTLDEDKVANSQISFKHSELRLLRNVTTDSDGKFLLTHAYEGTYQPTLSFRGRAITARSLMVGKSDSTKSIALNTTKLEGDVFLEGNVTAKNAVVKAYDHLWGNSIVTHTDSIGHYALDLLPGNFTITSTFGLNAAASSQLLIDTKTPRIFNMTMSPYGVVSGNTSIGGLLRGYVYLDFRKVSGSLFTLTTTSDGAGSFSVSLPVATYDVSARHYKTSSLYAFLGQVTVVAGVDKEMNPTLLEGVVVEGVAYSVDKTRGPLRMLNISFSNAQGRLTVMTSLEGAYRAYLPRGEYVVHVNYQDLTYLKNERFEISRTYDIGMQVGDGAFGRVSYDRNRDGLFEHGEGVSEALVSFTESSGAKAAVFTDEEGNYQITLPSTGIYTMSFSKTGFRTDSLGPASLRSLTPHFNPSLVPINVTIHGSLLLHGSPLGGKAIAVELIPVDEAGIAASAMTTPSSGSFTTALTPGVYQLKVDEAIGLSQPLVRYQNATNETLNIEVGQSSVVHDVSILVRASVSGNVKVSGVTRKALMIFQGPEEKQFTSTNGSFDLMLAQGAYTLYANYSMGSTLFATFQEIIVLDPVNLDIELERATVVEGNLMHRGSMLRERASLVFISDRGPRLNTTTSNDGSYSASLMPGHYAISVEHHSEAILGGVNRFVKYTSSASFEITAGTISLVQDLDLQMSLDNTTIIGRIEFQGLPSTGILDFRPTGTEGLNTTGFAFADGTFDISVAPGEYILYVHDPVTHGALLQQITVEHQAEMSVTFSLAKGYRVSGITTYLDDARISSKIQFTDPVIWTTYSDGNGYYEIYLPSGNYRLSVLATVSEHEMTVGYEGTAFVNVLDGPELVNFQLARVPRREVSLGYNESDAVSVSPGGTIRYSITVVNNGNVPDTIELEGATVGWTITFDRNPIAVDFGSINGALVNKEKIVASIMVPFDAKVEHSQVSITGSSVNDTSVRYTLQLKIDVKRSKGIILRVSDSKPVYDGRFLNYTLDVVNSGNGVESVGVSVDNAGDVEIMGWKASIMVNKTVPKATTVEGIIVQANSTTQVTMVIQSVGGRAGVEVMVRAYLQNISDIGKDEARESKISIPTVMPSLRLQGSVAVGGSNIERQAPMNTTLVAVTASLGFVAALFIISATRDRWRRSRR